MISKELYEFLVNDLGCPYDGKIQGVGEAYSHLILTNDEVPNDLAENVNGEFYQPNYVSVVTQVPTMSDDLIARKILENIVSIRSDGTYDVWDVDRQRSIRFSSNIKTKIDVYENRLSIDICDNEGNSYQYVTDNIQDYINQIDGSIPWGQVGFDITGAAFDYSEHLFQSLKTKQKSRMIQNMRKTLKKGGLKIKANNSTIYNKKIPKFYKNTGRLLLVTSIVFIAEDIVSNRAIKASNVLDAAMLGVSFIPPYGWVVGVAYFGLDIIISQTTQKSIGDYLDSALNSYTPLSDGIIYDFETEWDSFVDEWYNFWGDVDLPNLMY